MERAHSAKEEKREETAHEKKTIIEQATLSIVDLLDRSPLALARDLGNALVLKIRIQNQSPGQPRICATKLTSSVLMMSANS